MNLLHIARLPQNPHQLCTDGLGRHVKGLKHLWTLADVIADLIYADVAALILYLRGQDNCFARRKALLQRLQKVAPRIAGNAAHAKAFQNQRVIFAQHVRAE